MSTLNLGGFRFRRTTTSVCIGDFKIRYEKDTQKKIFAGGELCYVEKFYVVRLIMKKGVKLVLPLQTVAFAVEKGRRCSFQQSLANQNSRGFSFGYARVFFEFCPVRYLTAVVYRHEKPLKAIICRHSGLQGEGFCAGRTFPSARHHKKSPKSGESINNDWPVSI